MVKFPVHIPELEQFPVEKRGTVLKECADSPEFKRRTGRIRLYLGVGYTVVLVAMPWFTDRPFARTNREAIIYAALAIFGALFLMLVVPFFTDVRILRQLIREKLRN